MAINSDKDTEFDGRRDRLNRYRRPHVVDAPEALSVLHNGEARKPSDREDHWHGLAPLPTGQRKPKYAVPKWKGSTVPEPDQ